MSQYKSESQKPQLATQWERGEMTVAVRAQQRRSFAIGTSSGIHSARDAARHTRRGANPDRSGWGFPAIGEPAVHEPSVQDFLVDFQVLASKDLQYEPRLAPGDFGVEAVKRSAESLRFPQNTSNGQIVQSQEAVRRHAHELSDKIRVGRDGRAVFWGLGVRTGQGRVVFYDVVLRETIEVDGSSVPAEKDTSQGQEVSQGFRKVIYELDRLDEIVDREVPAVAITKQRAWFSLVWS